MSLLKSHSNFFHGNDLTVCRDKVIQLLKIWDYTQEQRKIYLNAFDYFVKHPEKFDGATMTEEMNDIPYLDLDAMLHDYLYIALNASANWEYMVKADKLFKKEMRRRQKSSWNSAYRNTALMLKTPYWVVKCYFKGRKITTENRVELDRIFKTLEL